MESYLYGLISTYVPEHFEILTSLAGGRLVKEERDGCTYANGVLHSFDDKPAEIRPNGTQIWYKNGKTHRDGDLPAIIWADGVRVWCQNGYTHRENDLPAIIFADGDVMWYKNGERYFPYLN